MKLITAIIQIYTLDAVQAALDEIGVNGMTVTEVKGHGRQKGHTDNYKGAEYVVDFLPKVRLDVAVTDNMCSDAISVICKAANNDRIGAGKIFVTNLEQVIRIRTGESGDEAL